MLHGWHGGIRFQRYIWNKHLLAERIVDLVCKPSAEQANRVLSTHITSTVTLTHVRHKKNNGGNKTITLKQ